MVFFLEVKIVDWVVKRKLRRLFTYGLENKKPHGQGCEFLE
jgi:hypothetical protein